MGYEMGLELADHHVGTFCFHLLVQVGDADGLLLPDLDDPLSNRCKIMHMSNELG